jgi:hypothetical protein
MLGGRALDIGVHGGRMIGIAVPSMSSGGSPVVSSTPRSLPDAELRDFPLQAQSSRETTHMFVSFVFMVGHSVGDSPVVGAKPGWRDMKKPRQAVAFSWYV